MALRVLLSKPHLAGKFVSLGGHPSSLFPVATASVSSNPCFANQYYHSLPSNHIHIITTTTTTTTTVHHPIITQQIRNKWTKTKLRQREKMLHREKRVARGLPAKPLPPKYIPKDRPVINAISREERDAESRRFDEAASEELKAKIDKQAENEENYLRFQFDGLQMSERVRRLFDLKNGNQKEVVNSQKRRGMELFQLREGDTGSSAVQVVALTTRIQQLQTHMAKHLKDKSTKRGLDALYVRRRKVLDYMERKDFQSYRKVVKSLGLVR